MFKNELYFNGGQVGSLRQAGIFGQNQDHTTPQALFETIKDEKYNKVDQFRLTVSLVREETTKLSIVFGSTLEAFDNLVEQAEVSVSSMQNRKEWILTKRNLHLVSLPITIGSILEFVRLIREDTELDSITDDYIETCFGEIIEVMYTMHEFFGEKEPEYVNKIQKLQDVFNDSPLTKQFSEG